MGLRMGIGAEHLRGNILRTEINKNAGVGVCLSVCGGY